MTRGRLLAEVLPTLTDTVRGGLLAQERPDLAVQLDELIVGGWCLCGDSFCQTFSTEDRTAEGEPDTIEVQVPVGMLLVHLEDDRVVEIEALYYPPLT